MSWFGKLFKDIFVDDMNNPPKRQQMSPEEYYNYLLTSRKLTPEKQAMLEYLHKALGKDKWD